MAVTLDHLLPSLKQSLDGVGFLFGAGTSFQAGYPLMSTLTRRIVSALVSDERMALDNALFSAGQVYNDASATPNIEEIADFVIAHALDTGDAKFSALERRLRELIVHNLLSVTTPDISHHVAFFRALKRRTFGLPTTVWIFTTNYDILFETAAACAGVRLENGFSGAVIGHFDPSRFGQLQGTSDGTRFTSYPGLVVKLVKLHGSLSWHVHDNQLIEQHPDSLPLTTARTVVLPRRRKVLDTLAAPYDQLFAHASRAIGQECRYLVSCGFSYGDDHISQTLLLPALFAGRCTLSALSEYEPPGLTPFKTLPTFRGFFSDHVWEDATASAESTKLWKFNELVSAL